jgi:hypothetical protein
MAPKKQWRRVVSYTLSTASARQQFEDGLEAGDFDLQDRSESTWTTTRGHSEQRQRLKQRNQRAQRESALLQGEESNNVDAPELNAKQEQDLLALIELFAAQHDPQAIYDVFRAVATDFDAALAVRHALQCGMPCCITP